MSRRALVSGGAGFIGSHVTELLLSRGYHVDIVDNLSSGKRENVPAGATLHVADIGSADAAALVRGVRYDGLCHLAAQTDPPKSLTPPPSPAAAS